MTPTPNYAALHAECVRHLQNLIRLDTSNPPGNEIIAAEYVRAQLAEAGVQCEVVESAPGRANLRAVLKGDGSARPILLMSHLDVVPVEPEFWTHSPFSGDVIDGYVWGRGATDMKQWTAWHLTIFLALARARTPLKRDVVLLCTADEENGSYMGIGWLVKNKPDWLDAEYGLSEGGGGEMQVDGKTFFPCRVGEKGACRFHLIAHGSPGHASRPHSDNALVKLGAALERIGNTPMRLRPTDTVRGMLHDVFAHVSGGPALVADLLNHDKFEAALARAPLSPSMKITLNAQLRNTATPTILHPSGSRINVIPSTAQASLDGRPIPGVSVDEFTEEVRAIIGDDIEAVEIDVYEFWEGTSSRFDTELFGVMQSVTQEVAGARLLPFLTTGASDGRYAEPLGVQVYGFGPMRYEPGAAPADLAHAHDERISLANVDLGLRTLYETVMRIAT